MGKDQIERLSNFLPLSRDFFNHAFWRENRPFSKAEAWLDLVRRANFKDSEETAVVGYNTIQWGPGQLRASYRWLAGKWDWSLSKVTRFLNMLSREGMITVHTMHGQSIITLVNFGRYNLGAKSAKPNGADDDENPEHESEQQTEHESEREKVDLTHVSELLRNAYGNTDQNGDGNSGGTLAEQDRDNTNTVLITDKNLNNTSNTTDGGKKGKTKIAKEEAPVVLPWSSDAFASAWADWKEYKLQEHKFKYKAAKTEQAALSQLQKDANNSEEEAIAMLRNAIARAWKGFYSINKNSNNATAKPKPADRTAGSYTDGW